MEPETIYNETPKGLGETGQQGPPTGREDTHHNNSDEVTNRGEGRLAHLGQDEYRTKSDIDLLRNAINRHARFPIPDHIRADAAVWLAEVASSKRYDGRARVNAVKALADLDRLNMEEELRAAGGARVNLDITSGGKPIGDLKGLSTEELEQRLKALEGGGS